MRIQNSIKKTLEKTSELELSMSMKLFVFLLLLVVTMLIGVFSVFLLTGNFNSGLNESKRAVQKELSYLSKNVQMQYGKSAVNAVELSKTLSFSIEKELALKESSIAELKTNPQLLEQVVSNEYEKLFFALQRANASGAFIILDATVNPNLPNAQHSKAGLYLKNMEPNILNDFAPNILMLRGFSSIGRQNAVSLHSQWAMEFDVENAPYYNTPIDQAKSNSFSLSRLYYWTPSTMLANTSEEVMICSVPLVDSKGNVFGVCGIEISAMLFKLSHMPDNSNYRRMFCTLAPYQEQQINTSQAFFSGSYSARNIAQANQSLTIVRDENRFNAYVQSNGSNFTGFHEAISLYPNGSPFEQEQWLVAVMMPDEDIASIAVRTNMKLLLAFLSLLFLGIVVSLYLSKRYIKPIKQSFNQIRSNNFNSLSKTNITEIDDLIEFLYSSKTKVQLSQKNNKNSIQKLPSAVFDEFQKNTKTLSPAERAVFDLYVEGHTAKEITEILCLSINTIKTHNKRIYMKLNVASREELLVYVNMLKEAGQEITY